MMFSSPIETKEHLSSTGTAAREEMRRKNIYL
jgi:hypothetical protein